MKANQRREDIQHIALSYRLGPRVAFDWALRTGWVWGWAWEMRMQGAGERIGCRKRTEALVITWGLGSFGGEGLAKGRYWASDSPAPFAIWLTAAMPNTKAGPIVPPSPPYEGPGAPTPAQLPMAYSPLIGSPLI